MTVASYYAKMKTILDQLGAYSKVPKCNCGGCTCGQAHEYACEREEEKLHQFLMGLEEATFGTTCSQILNMDPLANISKVYSMIMKEESHRTNIRQQEEHVEVVALTTQMAKPKATAPPTHG